MSETIQYGRIDTATIGIGRSVESFATSIIHRDNPHRQQLENMISARRPDACYYIPGLAAIASTIMMPLAILGSVANTLHI